MDLVHIDAESTKIVLFEDSAGTWYARAYFVGDKDEEGGLFGRELSHEEVLSKFAQECEAKGIHIRHRGGARLSRPSTQELRVIGKSVSLGSIQNEGVLKKLLEEAFPHMAITIKT